MSHFSHHCMHMDARTYANEMLMRLDRFLDENLSLIIFVKLRSRFLMCFEEIKYVTKYTLKQYICLVELTSFTCCVIKRFR